MASHFIVFDQESVIWGSGKTKPEARKDAYRWHKENGPAFLPFKPAMPCTKMASELGSDDPYKIVNGVVYAAQEIIEAEIKKAESKVIENELTEKEFKKLDLHPKLNVIFSMLREIRKGKEDV